MRNPLALAALGAALLTPALLPRPAAAQIVCANCVNEFSEMARWGQQASQMVSQLRQMQQQYQQLQSTYYAISHVTDLGSAVSALGMVGIQNPLPVNPYAVQGLLNGTGGANGVLSNLGGLYNGTTTANRLYQTPGDTWLSQQINQNGAGIAGAQAVALQLYQSAAQRIPLLNELQARIGSAKDPADREALIARVGVEQSYIQAQQVQATALGNYMAAQYQLRTQQREEASQAAIDAVLADARAHGVMR